MADYLHHVPGRLRVRSAAVKRNAARAATVEQFVTGLHGVREVDVRTVTGSVTVFYDPELTSPDAIIAALRGAGYVSPDADPAKASPSTGAVGPTTTRVTETVLNIALEKVLERSATAMIAALV